jgi:hypothetical protein
MREAMKLSWGSSISSALACIGALAASAALAGPPQTPSCAAVSKNDRLSECECAAITFPGSNHGLWEPDFSGDGLRLYFNNHPFGPKTDLYFLTRSSDSEPFTDQRAEKVPLVNSDGRSDRGASVLTDPDGCDRIFFVSERASAGDVYEAKSRRNSSGKCVWSKPRPLEGGDELNEKCVLNVNALEGGKRLITNGPSVCDARLTVWERSAKGQWLRRTDPSDPDVASLEVVNRWGDVEDKRNRCGFPCFRGGCGILDPHITRDGKHLFFVRKGDIYHAPYPVTSTDAIRRIDALEVSACPHPRSRKPWLEGPGTHTDAKGNRWLFYHFAGFRGRLGAHRW